MINKVNFKNKMKLFIISLLLICAGISVEAQTQDGSEMRAVWVATVKNIDYPTYKFLSVEDQKNEFTDLLDSFSIIGINAIMFQVRPAADAFYKSEFEPWSEWLTGKQGKAPEPYYDPLKFMIEECHKREIEFHAWINPFRAVATIEYADIAEDHISKKKPEWIFTYDIHKYFDPGIPEVREYITNIITDIVKRYNIDGVHFDDYFYPYPVRNSYNGTLKIPDHKSYKKYNSDSLSLEDWRRSNMNKFIKGVNDAIKNEKPRLPFGVAPSGVWRNQNKDPNGSATRGLAHYDYLYSDVLKWLQNDWIDYVAPQLYWPIGNKNADYEILVKWWSEHTYGKHLYIGQAVYQAGKDAKYSSWREPDQLLKQLQINRKNPKVLGSIFYRAKSMTDNPFGFCDSLKNNYYLLKVQTPKMLWLEVADTLLVLDVNIPDTVRITNNDNVSLGTVNVTKLGKKLMLSWNEHSDTTLIYKVYKFKKKEDVEIDDKHFLKQTNKNFIILERKKRGLERKKYKIIITSENNPGEEKIESEAIYVKLIK